MDDRGGLDVLVVDDDPAIRDALRRALEPAGHRVRLAGDGTKPGTGRSKHSW